MAPATRTVEAAPLQLRRASPGPGGPFPRPGAVSCIVNHIVIIISNHFLWVGNLYKGVVAIIHPHVEERH